MRSPGASEGYSPYSPPLTRFPIIKAPPPAPWSVPLPLSATLRPNSVKTSIATLSAAPWSSRSWKKSIIARERSARSVECVGPWLEWVS